MPLQINLELIPLLFSVKWIQELIRNFRVPRRDDYEKRPVLSATIHPDIKRTLLGISERTGMSVSQVSDEVLYTGLIEMRELDAHW